MAIVNVCGVDDSDDEHNDIGTDDAMLLAAHKYEILGLSSCKLSAI